MKRTLRWIACVTAVIMLAGCGNAAGTKVALYWAFPVPENLFISSRLIC
ncbi:MAG: hypothetical protein HDR04_17840 [Lachnospiraceae bacterium]|nr:hypothetical protein [Lachnospiraceae bacterium]